MSGANSSDVLQFVTLFTTGRKQGKDAPDRLTELEVQKLLRARAHVIRCYT